MIVLLYFTIITFWGDALRYEHVTFLWMRTVKLRQNSDCRVITLQLTIVRQRDKLEGWFKHFLVEDKGINPAATSYVDFLCQMHKEIRNLMNWSICGYSSHTTRNELGRLCQWRQDRCVKKFPPIFAMARNCSSEALLSVLSNGETLNHHGEQMVNKTFIWLIENVLSEFCFKVSCIQHTQRS